jgi:hypothetical protein
MSLRAALEPSLIQAQQSPSGLRDIGVSANARFARSGQRIDRCCDYNPPRSQRKLKLPIAGKSRVCLSLTQVSKSVIRFKCVVQSEFTAATTAEAKKTVFKEKRAHLFTSRLGDCHGA